MDMERLQRSAEEGDPEAQYILFKEKERRGEVVLPETPAMHSRRCFRCNAELTDEMSLSRGMGKDCWGHLESSQLRVEPNFEKVKELHGKFLSNFDFHYWEASVVIARFGEHLYKEKLTQKATKEIVRKTLWALSFGLPHHLNDILIDLIDALGYPLLVQILLNQAVIGRAQVRVFEGRLFLKSPRPKKIVSTSLRKAGGYYDRFSLEWNFPGHRALEVAKVVKRYFLNIEGLEEALEELKNAKKEEPPPTDFSNYIEESENGDIRIKTPYNASFVSDLKEKIPWAHKVQGQWHKFREFDWTDKAWVVRGDENILVAKKLVQEYFLEKPHE